VTFTKILKVEDLAYEGINSMIDDAAHVSPRMHDRSIKTTACHKSRDDLPWGGNASTDSKIKKRSLKKKS
jgi:hypothetical protein